MTGDDPSELLAVAVLDKAVPFVHHHLKNALALALDALGNEGKVPALHLYSQPPEAEVAKLTDSLLERILALEGLGPRVANALREGLCHALKGDEYRLFQESIEVVAPKGHRAVGSARRAKRARAEVDEQEVCTLPSQGSVIEDGRSTPKIRTRTRCAFYSYISIFLT